MMEKGKERLRCLSQSHCKTLQRGREVRVKEAERERKDEDGDEERN